MHEYFLASRQTRQAFREVVAETRLSTVRLLRKNETVARGAIVDAGGLILTKASQIGKADTVELPDGRRVPMVVIATHQASDLALLQVSASSLVPVRFSSQEPAVGAWMATVDTQLDPAAIGVLSVSRRAIPASSERGILGIELEQINQLQILKVFPNSGAAEAGLQAGDVLLQVDQQVLATRMQLMRTLRAYRPGDTLVVRVRRDENEIECSATLTHPFGEFLSRIALQNQMGGALSFRRDSFEAAYQCDTVLSPEECGGPVVDLEGNVLGVNIARVGRTETLILPADVIEAAISQMKSSLAKTSVESPAAAAVSPR